jgi:hypothetical protein
MSNQVHFWLRITALGVILALQFGPRFWNATQSAPASAAGVTSVALQR